MVQGSVSSCPDTLLDPHSASSGSAEALQLQHIEHSLNLSLQIQEKGAGQGLHTALLVALWPPLLLGHWQYFHITALSS